MQKHRTFSSRTTQSSVSHRCQRNSAGMHKNGRKLNGSEYTQVVFKMRKNLWVMGDSYCTCIWYSLFGIMPKLMTLLSSWRDCATTWNTIYFPYISSQFIKAKSALDEWEVGEDTITNLGKHRTRCCGFYLKWMRNFKSISKFSTSF